jgi:uncharacterized damage-inducible protein DinB
MNATTQLAQHLRAVYFGGNWSCVNFKDTLEGITFSQAQTKPEGMNSIAVLSFHIQYYLDPVCKVLQGEPLVASDKESFAVPVFESEATWQDFIQEILAKAERFALAVEQLDEAKLYAVFDQEKYGTYYRNILGIIEHTHYHLGQITLIKKMV